MGDHRAPRTSRRAIAQVSPTENPHLSTQPTAGKRRAAKPPRRALRLLPSGPLVAGVATLAVAAFGATTAVEAAEITPAPMEFAYTPAGALSGTTTTMSSDVLSGRGAQVSRSSSSRGSGASAGLLKQAETALKERNSALAQVDQKVQSRAQDILENAWVMPLSGYRISATFGAASYLWSRVHTGQDLAAPIGTPIHAIANGTITETGYAGSYGNRTILTLDDGTEIWFCHQTSIYVNVGERVNGGDVIGTVGSTGNSTGPHLHLEVRPGAGDPVDPVGACAQHGLAF